MKSWKIEKQKKMSITYAYLYFLLNSTTVDTNSTEFAKTKITVMSLCMSIAITLRCVVNLLLRAY